MDLVEKFLVFIVVPVSAILIAVAIAKPNQVSKKERLMQQCRDDGNLEYKCESYLSGVH